LDISILAHSSIGALFDNRPITVISRCLFLTLCLSLDILSLVEGSAHIFALVSEEVFLGFSLEDDLAVLTDVYHYLGHQRVQVNKCDSFFDLNELNTKPKCDNQIIFEFHGAHSLFVIQK
jgi:hypothetical protein